LLERWQHSFPQVAQIWQQNLPAFIEEDGELSFSVLSRTVIADCSKSSFQTLNKAYTGQSLYREAMSELEGDLQCFSRSASLHTILEANSKEVEQLSKFLDLHLRCMHRGSFKLYPPLQKGVYFYSAPSSDASKSYVIVLDIAKMRNTPSTALAVHLFEPPSISDRVNEVLNDVANSLLVDNFSGSEVKYILCPEDLESESEEASEWEEL